MWCFRATAKLKKRDVSTRIAPHIEGLPEDEVEGHTLLRHSLVQLLRRTNDLSTYGLFLSLDSEPRRDVILHNTSESLTKFIG